MQLRTVRVGDCFRTDSSSEPFERMAIVLLNGKLEPFEGMTIFSELVHDVEVSPMTRRSGVYLEVPQRNAGLVDPHSLHIFMFRCQGLTRAK